MCVACNHTIHRAKHHFGWDNSFKPEIIAKPGETIHFECQDSSGGQLGADATVASIAALDFGKINPVTGPVYVEGAKPGDALKVTLRKFIPSGLGWTANIPGFGLLADQFPAPHLHHWHYDVTSRTPALIVTDRMLPRTNSHCAVPPTRPSSGRPPGNAAGAASL